MKNPGLAILLICFIGCSSPQRPESAAFDSTRRDISYSTEKASVSSRQNTITCEAIGPAKLSHSQAELEAAVGRENIRQDSLFLEGNFEGFVTTLWADTPQEIIVHWTQRTQPFQSIKMLEVKHPESVYRFGNGIKIGTSLKEIVQLNTKPITIYGFGWDNGGTFVNFSNGKLAQEFPCFGGVFQLQHSGNSSGDLNNIMGDHHIKSDEPALVKYGAILVKIRITGNKD